MALQLEARCQWTFDQFFRDWILSVHFPYHPEEYTNPSDALRIIVPLDSDYDHLTEDTLQLQILVIFLLREASSLDPSAVWVFFCSAFFASFFFFVLRHCQTSPVDGRTDGCGDRDLIIY